MKKTYINPTIEIIDIKMDQHLLAGSLPLGAPGNADEAEAPEYVFEEQF